MRNYLISGRKIRLKREGEGIDLSLIIFWYINAIFVTLWLTKNSLSVIMYSVYLRWFSPDSVAGYCSANRRNMILWIGDEALKV